MNCGAGGFLPTRYYRRGVRIKISTCRSPACCLPAFVSSFRLCNASEQIDVWFPYRIDTALPYRGIRVAARLRPGVTLDQANAELQMFEAQFERKYPDADAAAKATFHCPSIA